jgi:hypothetical protein
MNSLLDSGCPVQDQATRAYVVGCTGPLSARTPGDSQDKFNGTFMRSVPGDFDILA